MLDKTMQWIRKITLDVSVIAVLIMAVMEICEIFARSVFSHSFLIVDEFAGYLMSAMVFTGLVHSYASGSFVRVEAIYGLIKGKAKDILDFLYTIILFIFTLVYGYYSVLLNVKSFTKHLVSTGYYMTPLGYPQLFMSFGIIMFCIYLVLDIIKKAKALGGEKQ